ncbi:MAG: hypothetical protein RL033_659 [Pseudomonadota bacterium]
MFNQLAALGLATLVFAAPAAAHAWDTAPPSSYPGAYPSTYPGSYPSTNPGSYPSAYPGSYPSYPAPTYSPAPQEPSGPQYSNVVYQQVLSRADYDYDGGITLAEAHAYGRAEFARDDVDRNGVLTRRELRGPGHELARGASRGGVVTFTEFDANVQQRFCELDHDRNGYLSSYELGRPAPQRGGGVSWSWRWSL